MTPTQRVLIVGGVLLSGLGLPRVSYAVTGCSNANLRGIYNAQISSGSLMNVLNTVNGSTTTSGGTTSSSGSTTTTPAGLGSNPSSLSGPTPGLGRFFFDGNGSIVGLSSANVNVPIGSYTVASDCSATVKLNSGRTFIAVVAAGGARVLFLESSGSGTAGELDLSVSACNAADNPQSFAFSYFGAQRAASTAGTSGTAAGSMFQPAAAVGSLALDGQGAFTMKEWFSSATGTAQLANASGTYAIGADCSIKLTFQTSDKGAPVAFRGLLVSGSSGLIMVQTDQTATDLVPGTLISQ